MRFSQTMRGVKFEPQRALASGIRTRGVVAVVLPGTRYDTLRTSIFSYDDPC